MKKLQSLLAGAVIALGFAACEDVPAPYGVYNEGDDHTVTDVILSADFSTSLGAFQNVTTDGEGAWIIDYKTAKATGYDNGTKVTTAGTYYLVSPEVTVPEGPTHITFDYILRYNKGDENQQLLINENYNADNPTEGWVVLNQKWTEGSDWTTFEAADVAVPEDYAGKTVRVALRYSTNATSGSTWEVKNFKWLKGEASSGGGETPIDDGTPKTLPYTATFATDMQGWTNFTFSGEGAWVIDFKTAKATGYDNATKATTAGTYYLISPEVQLSEGAAHLEYAYILRYNKADENQQVLINENYDESNPAAGWVVVNQKHTEGSDWSTFTTDNIKIPADFQGKKVRFALRYSTNATSGSTWEVQSFSVLEGEGAKDGDQGNGSTANTDPQEGDGTMDNPYNVAAAQAAYTGTELVGKAVTGYIVGYCSGTTIGTAKFELGNDVVNTNLLIADNPEETNPNKCVAIQLARGNARTDLNLKDNPFNFGMKVLVEGTLFGPYLGMTGVKSLTYYQIVR